MPKFSEPLVIDGTVPLTSPRREKFVQLFLNGVPKDIAYIKAGFRSKDLRIAHRSAEQLIKRPSTRARIRHLQGLIDESQTKTRGEKLKILDNIIDSTEYDNNRLTAIRTHNDMLGHVQRQPLVNIDNRQQTLNQTIVASNTDISQRLQAARAKLLTVGLTSSPHVADNNTADLIEVPAKPLTPSQ